jgi:hypothetical protein
MYEFVGKLMGLALRTRNLLNFHFPAIVWKPLVGAQVTMDDIEAIDVLCMNAIRGLETTNTSARELFDREMQDVMYTVVGSDSQTYPLCPGGEQKALTYDNRHEYVALMKKYRLEESKLQVSAIKRGLGMVVPLDSLCMFTWRELETMVCGRGFAASDVALLRENTTVSDPNAQHVLWLWDILENDFNDEQREQFLIFVWGRNRLPLTSAEFDTKFKITPKSGGNNAFPMAHTCFFQVDLPAYTDRTAMHDRILTAITMCGVIDGD